MQKSLISQVVLSVLTVCVLSACQHNQPIPGDKKTVDIDRSLLQKCPELTKAKSGSDEDLKQWSKETLDRYVECSTRQDKLGGVVKKAFNITD